MERKIQIEPVFCLLLATAVLLIPLRWLAAWFAAVTAHELFHIAALAALGGRIRSFQVGTQGVFIHTDSLNGAKEFVASLAGPLGSFLLLFVYRYTPLVALCAFVQGAFNLLPLYPLDGGRALRCLLVRLLGREKGERASHIAALTVCAGFLLLGVFCIRISFLPLVIGTALVIKTGKIPCKTLAKRVQ